MSETRSPTRTRIQSEGDQGGSAGDRRARVGRGSASPASVARRRTSRCCASWSSTSRGWMRPREFEDAIAACNLLPGPASTQLAIFCAWRVAGPPGAIVGGLAFIVPAVVADAGAVGAVPRATRRRVGARRRRRGRRRGRGGRGPGRGWRCSNRAGGGSAAPRRAARAGWSTSRSAIAAGALLGAVPGARAARLRRRSSWRSRPRCPQLAAPCKRGAGAVVPPRPPRSAGSARWRGSRSRSARCRTAAAS